VPWVAAAGKLKMKIKAGAQKATKLFFGVNKKLFPNYFPLLGQLQMDTRHRIRR
jgi:hypothetical protein